MWSKRVKRMEGPDYAKTSGQSYLLLSQSATQLGITDSQKT